MPNMQAIRIHRAGDAFSLSLDEVDIPSIQNDSQVLVRLKAAGINPIDTKIRTRPEAFPLELPYIPGCDGAGIIEAVGSAVRHFKVGDEVFYCQCGFHGVQGNYAEYAVVEQHYLAHKPHILSFEHAAALPLVFITAWEALFDRARLQHGQRVLIQGGAGGVGHIAIQLAKERGCEVATTVSSDEKAEFVKGLGADCIINYRQEDVASRVNNWSDGGADVAFDTVGGKVLEQCFSCVRPYGDVVTILQPDADTQWSEARLRNLRFSMELMLSPAIMQLPAEQTRHGNLLKNAAALCSSRHLRVHVAENFPLAEASAAHSRLERDHPPGKFILTLG
jgi:NADPH2:quinone reductase